MKKIFFIAVILLWSTNIIIAQGERPTLVSVKSTDYFYGVKTGLTAMGGMSKYVKPGQKVGLLINSGFEEKGAYVNPDIAIAVVVECFEAGASEVICLQDVKLEYWQKSNLFERFKDQLLRVKSLEANAFPAKFNEIDFVRLDTIIGAKSLVKPEIIKGLFEVDVFISVPIAKHHATTLLTCALKNTMGVCTRATNVTMHLNGPKRNDHDYLAQCIADLNIVRKMDLIITDVTEVLSTNGPGGPGELLNLNRIVVGTDPVALDVYCSGLLGFDADEVYTISKGFLNGLGEKDLSKIKIVEL